MGLSSKRTRGYQEREKRKGRQREKVPCIFLIVEGESERIYFRKFTKRNCRVEVFVGDNGNPEKLVKKAEDLLTSGRIDLDEKDELWCVFDRDDNSQECINRAKDRAGKNGFRIVFSNPCWEIWLLWHFEESFSYRESSQNLKQELKQNHIKNYHETGDYFDLLKPHMEDAISRAKKAKQRYLTAGKGELTLEFNPSSSVFELLDEIKRLQGYS